MALVTANGNGVLDLTLTLPRSGAWVADLLVPDAFLAGAVTIDINSGALRLAGTTTRGGQFVDTNHLRVVAGAGGLQRTAAPRHYSGTNVRVVLGDLVAAAGERLSPTADAGILATGLDAWTTSAVPVRRLVSQLLAAAAPGASWRMLTDGTLWVGRETWPDAGVDRATYQIREDNAEQGSMLIAVDAPFLLPGTTFEGRRVSRTDHVVLGNGGAITTRVWFENAAAPIDRLKASIAKLVRDVTLEIDYRAHYPARVVAQSGGTVDVQPDQVGGKDLLPDMANVPLLLGLPGASVDGVAGGRVMIGWLAGDPSRPYAIAFDAENVVEGELLIAVRRNLGLVLGGKDGASAPPLGEPLIEYLTNIAAAINAIVPGSVLPPDPLTLLAKKVTVA